MHVVLLAVGALVTLVGGALMRFGLPLDEYGNSPLLVSGTIALVGGLILIALSFAVRSLNRIAERLDIQPLPLPPMADISHAMPPPRPTARPEPPISPPAPPAPEPRVEPAPDLRATPLPESRPAPPSPEPRLEPPSIAPARPAAAPSGPKPSLLGWLSKSRKPEIVGRKDAIPPGPADGIGRADPEPPPTRTAEREPTLRSPPAPAGNGRAAPVPAGDLPPGVAVYKSGVIEGMAYTLYTDGSIEAELPQGRIRFATVEALQSYLAGR